MSTLKASWARWYPHTRQDREAILQELQEVLASSHFCNSKRYPALLRYVVLASLGGKADLLKERTLGIEVFHRQPDYDTNTDTIVRYTAGEVRKRLSLHYHDHDSRLQISLPPGSYAPEFLCAAGDEAAIPHPRTLHPPEVPATFDLPAVFEAAQPLTPPHTALLASSEAPFFLPSPPPEASQASPAFSIPHPGASQGSSRRGWIALLGTIAVLIAIVFARHGALLQHSPQQTALDEFWTPVLHEPGATLICSGGVVFAPQTFSGVTTAGKDIAYPFVSMQIATAIARIAGQLERSGAHVQMQSSASTPLTDLRERPVILIGAYNNEWTLRLLSPLRFHFGDSPIESIVDREHPGSIWRRDPSLPYSSADDYALVARFHDTTTGSLIVVIAGIGRNGTEAAADFATNPHYLDLLRSSVGRDLGEKNIEAVLKIRVIDGKTGAPSLEAINVW